MLRINVGLSRKLSQDFNSRGFSLNIDGELPSDVLHNQDALVECSNRLFHLANLLLDEQVQRANANRDGRQPDRNGRRLASRDGQNLPDAGNGRREVSTSSNGNGHGNEDRYLTQAQGRAITNMTRRLGYDVNQWVHDAMGVSAVGKLSVKQASDAIDRLKQEIEAGSHKAAR